MASFGKKSMSRLKTCDENIQTVMLAAIKYMDFSIIYGQRTPDEQFTLFKKGRTQNQQGELVIYDLNLVVTYKDGTEKKSKHNYVPLSFAVDIALYPTLWEKKELFYELGGIIKTVQEQLFYEGKITTKLKWGFDLWEWDEGHWEI